MNKLAIPAILTATVLVAGIFAFMPVEQASTVHASTILPALEASTLVRVQTFLDFVSGGTGLAGTVTYSLTGNAAGAFQIEKLFLCDLEAAAFSGPSVSYTTETSIIGTGGTGSILMGDDVRHYRIELINSTGDLCVDILGLDSDGTRLQLGGDENNDIIVNFVDGKLTGAENDGGTLVAYITGLTDSNDLEVVTNLS